MSLVNPPPLPPAYRISMTDDDAYEFKGWWLSCLDQGLLPPAEDFVDQVFNGLLGTRDFEFTRFSSVNEQFCSLYTLHSASLARPGGRLLALIAECTFGPCVPQFINIKYLEVPKTFQGTGIGTQSVRNLIQLAQSLGIETIEVRASLDGGPYFWARIGFVPYEQSWRDCLPKIHDKLQQLRPQLTDDEYELAVDLLNTDTPESVGAIVNLSPIVVSVPPPQYVQNERSIPLGMALLADSNIAWNGYLYLGQDYSLLDEGLGLEQ